MFESDLCQFFTGGIIVSEWCFVVLIGAVVPVAGCSGDDATGNAYPGKHRGRGRRPVSCGNPG
jgi:hypothetical protein